MWLAIRCLRGGLIDGGHILLAHDDGAQTRHLGIAAVEDNDLGLVPVQRLFNLGIPDGVAGQIEGLFRRDGRRPLR
jgi:hypothetical protein